MQRGRGDVMRKKIPVTIGSTNVFADLGYRSPDEALANAQLAARIADILKSRGAAAMLVLRRLQGKHPVYVFSYRGCTPVRCVNGQPWRDTVSPPDFEWQV